MKHRSEIEKGYIGEIQMDNQIKFILNDENEELFHWSDRMTMLLVLRGTCIFECQGEKKPMQQGNLWLLNPYTLYQLEKEAECDVLKIIFPENAQRCLELHAGEEVFCSSDLQEERHKDAFTELRKLLAELFLVCVKDGNENNLLVQSYLYRLLYCMKREFVVETLERESKTEEPLHRLRRILGRIHRDYGESVTLKQIAQEEYLSVNYLSRYFHQKTGIGFNQYLNQVRLKAAEEKMLRDTKLSVTEIAGRCGFGDSTQFIKKFQGQYKVSPRNYRKQIRQDVFKDGKTEVFEELLKYAEKQDEREHGIKERVRAQQIAVNVQVKGKRLQHKWKKLVNIGFAKEGLSAVIQNQLKIIQDEIGFEYIHFHGLLDDDMMIYSECEDGKAVYNFKYLDMLFDFFLSIKLKPYVELSFMPSALAKPSRNLFARPVYLSMPNDMRRWEELVRKLTVHCIHRYGMEEVEKWRFLPWSGPVGFSEYGQYTMDEYMELYGRTWRVLKEISPKLQVGGPAMESYYVLEENGNYDRFIQYAAENECFPDFIAIDCYPSKMNEKETGDSIILIEKSEVLSRVTSSDEDYMGHLLDYLEQYHKKINGFIPEIVFVEWNSTMWQRDLTNDTSFKAAYMAKNILENYDRAGAFGYWEISDYIEEVVPEQEEFHGGFGLFTCHNIKKSGYYCLKFLSGLGERLLGKGDGYFITKKRTGEVQIILYNYVHFNKLYRYRHMNGVDRTHRSGAFLPGESIQYRMNIMGLSGWGRIKIKEYEISEKGGSAYDLWKNLGAPVILTADEIGYLQKCALPLYHCREQDDTDEIQSEFLLQPNSVKLIILEKADSI